MHQESNPERHLVGHYAVLRDLRSDFRNYNLFALVCSAVKGHQVVDIGCGLAFLAGMLKAQGKSVIGIEPSHDMRVLAAQANPGVTVIGGSAEEVDTLVREPVDSVVMIDVLEHIEKDVEQVRKVRAILKKGGEFVFVVPAYQFLYGERDRQMGHYRRYSKKMLRDLFEQNGFTVEHLRYWNALAVVPYWISEKILRRPLESKLRQESSRGLSALVQKGLFFWFNRIENNVDFGFGLSIIGVAKKA